jgi:hypothetical protein
MTELLLKLDRARPRDRIQRHALTCEAMVPAGDG